MRANKTISLDADLIRGVEAKLPEGKAFSALVERLLSRWLKVQSRPAVESQQ